MSIIPKKHNKYLLFSLVLISFSLIFCISFNFHIKASETVPPSAERISVKMFGAKGDGVTDDRLPIQNALNSCVNKILYFPTGTYLVTGLIAIPSNTTIIGDNDVVIMAGPDYGRDAELFRTDNGHNISISNITFSGNIESNTMEKFKSEAQTSVNLFDIWGGDYIEIKKCNFIDNVCSGIRLMRGCSNINIDTCKFLNVDCGVIFMGVGDVDQLTVQNSLFDGHQNSEPISFFGKGTYSNIDILYNTMQNKTYGSCINGVSGTIINVNIIGNKMYNNSCGIILHNASNVEIVDNTITSNGLAIALEVTNSINLTNNSLSKTRGHALYIKNSSNINVSNNNITDCGYLGKEYHALDLRGKCDNVSIISNDLIRTDNNLSDCIFAVNCSGTLQISDNNFVNCKLDIYTDNSNVTLSNN